MRHLFSLIIILLISCSARENYVVATDPFDAAREFVSSCLKGDFEKASFYMIQDNENKKLLKEAEETFRAKPLAQQKQFAEASLQNVTKENISTTELIINYKNSYDHVGRKVKVVFVNNQWLIDFKYTFNPNL